MDLVNYGLRERYEQLKKRGDRLDDIKKIIDWESLRPLLKDLFTNDTEQGGKAFQSIVSFTNFSEWFNAYYRQEEKRLTLLNEAAQKFEALTLTRERETRPSGSGKAPAASTVPLIIGIKRYTPRKRSILSEIPSSSKKLDEQRGTNIFPKRLES